MDILQKHMLRIAQIAILVGAFTILNDWKTFIIIIMIVTANNIKNYL